MIACFHPILVLLEEQRTVCLLSKDGINRTEGELDMCKVMGENTNQTFLMLEVE